MDQPWRLLRYNTGTDKKAFVHFKNDFDAVIFNATIVAYSGASVADLVSMHAHKYIIDPQTHILQQDYSAISTTDNKTGEKRIKKSVLKYLKQLPISISEAIVNANGPISCFDVEKHLSDLVRSVFEFETEFVDSFIRQKQYDKYLQFANVKIEPKAVIAPYFMLKEAYSEDERKKWLEINKKSLERTIKINRDKGNRYPIAGQLVLEKSVLNDKNIHRLIKSAYDVPGYEYVFIWVDNFNSLEEPPQINDAFSRIVKMFNAIGKKPVMAYGGYESILLCADDCPTKLFGVAQSVGYGEYRPITPVGGGVPVNKYYFFPLHERLKFGDVASIMYEHGYFDETIEPSIRAKTFFNNICDCKICKQVIKNDINNFDEYNESIPFTIKTRNGAIERNRASTDAMLISAFHFLYSKKKEWDCVINSDFNTLRTELIEMFKEYRPLRVDYIEKWFSIYGN